MASVGAVGTPNLSAFSPFRPGFLFSSSKCQLWKDPLLPRGRWLSVFPKSSWAVGGAVKLGSLSLQEVLVENLLEIKKESVRVRRAGDCK